VTICCAGSDTAAASRPAPIRNFLIRLGLLESK
jgi:hypothetical protein